MKTAVFTTYLDLNLLQLSLGILLTVAMYYTSKRVTKSKIGIVRDSCFQGQRLVSPMIQGRYFDTRYHKHGIVTQKRTANTFSCGWIYWKSVEFQACGL